MKRLIGGLGMVLMLVVISVGQSAEAPAKKTAKEALQAFNDLIGSWRGTGMPEGTKAEKTKGAWQETVAWEWQFQGDPALKATYEKSKYFTEGRLRYLADKDAYQFEVQTVDKEKLVFEGTLKEHVLTLEREDEGKKEAQRLTFNLLHDNRYLCSYEVKAAGKTTFAKVYQVGDTKEGVPFATGSGGTGPECIVSGGQGTTKVMYKGQTYYVCCSGCRDAFNENPEKYIKEAEQKKAKAGK
jgi:YHS domain-containing protein